MHKKLLILLLILFSFSFINQTIIIYIPKTLDTSTLNYKNSQSDILYMHSYSNYSKAQTLFIRNKIDVLIAPLESGLNLYKFKKNIRTIGYINIPTLFIYTNKTSLSELNYITLPNEYKNYEFIIKNYFGKDFLIKYNDLNKIANDINKNNLENFILPNYFHKNFLTKKFINFTKEVLPRFNEIPLYVILINKNSNYNEIIKYLNINWNKEIVENDFYNFLKFEYSRFPLTKNIYINEIPKINFSKETFNYFLFKYLSQNKFELYKDFFVTK